MPKPGADCNKHTILLILVGALVVLGLVSMSLLITLLTRSPLSTVPAAYAAVAGSSSSSRPSSSSFTVYEVDEFSCNTPPTCIRSGSIQTYTKSSTYATTADALLNDVSRSLSNATGYCVTASQEMSPSTFFYQDCAQQYNFFGRGSISVVGEYREDLNYMIYRTETWIIVGGTGDFAGARGYVVIPPIDADGYYTVKFYLL